jgi:hypothetical protein
MGAKMRKAGWFCRAFIVKSEAIRTHKRPKANGSDMKQKKCKAKGCGVVFSPARPFQCWCSPECGLSIARAKKEQAETKARQAERRADKDKKEGLKNLGSLRKEAQTQFNRYIRFRDQIAGHGCICCGRPLNWNSGKPGGDVDAGHYLSRGASIELAFDERNVNAQAKSCNRPGGTTRAQFRDGMIDRYGVDVVDELEGPHELTQLRHDDLRAIRDKYRKMANDLSKSIEKTN